PAATKATQYHAGDIGLQKKGCQRGSPVIHELPASGGSESVLAAPLKPAHARVVPVCRHLDVISTQEHQRLRLVDSVATDPRPPKSPKVGGWGRRLLALRWPLQTLSVEMTYEPRGLSLALQLGNVGTIRLCDDNPNMVRPAV